MQCGYIHHKFLESAVCTSRFIRETLDLAGPPHNVAWTPSQPRIRLLSMRIFRYYFILFAGGANKLPTPEWILAGSISGACSLVTIRPESKAGTALNWIRHGLRGFHAH